MASDRTTLEQTRLCAGVIALADAAAPRPVPHEVLPRIRLQIPMITRPLITEWLARRVDERFQRCRARSG